MRWLSNAWLAGLAVIISGGLALLWRSNLKSFTSVQVTPRSDLAVADDARPFFDNYRHLGFDHVASADVRGDAFETIFAYLVSADRQTYAVVTDKLQCLASRFGQRVIVTIDHAALPTGPLQLRQMVPISDLKELGEAHQAGLAVLAAHGHQPDELVPARVLEFSMAIDGSTMKFLTTHPWLVLGQYLWGIVSRRPPDSRRILDDDVTATRIQAVEPGMIGARKAVG